jgi:hypothetical protein
MALGLRWLWSSPLMSTYWDRWNYKPPAFDFKNKQQAGWILASCYGGAWIYGWIYLNMPQLDIMTAIILAVMIWLAFILPSRVLAGNFLQSSPVRIMLENGYELATLLICACIFSILAV